MSEERKILHELGDAVADYLEARDQEDTLREKFNDGDKSVEDALDVAAEKTSEKREALEQILGKIPL